MTTHLEAEMAGRARGSALVAQTLIHILRHDEDAANDVIDGLTDQDLRFFAGSAIELALMLCDNHFRSRAEAIRYAEIVMLNATARSTTGAS